MACTIGKIDVFEPNDESWTCYKERLDQYFIANDVEDDKKVPALLSLIGPKTYRTLRDLSAPDLPKDKTYDALSKLLKEHFNPVPLQIGERFRFYKRDQKPEESINDYNVSLRKLSEHCNFGAVLNDSLRDRLVCGLKNESIQKRLLSEKELTYDKAVEIAIAMESAQRDVRELHGFPQIHKLSKSKGRGHANQQFNQKPPQPLKPCFRCNRTNHTPDQCNFKDAKCHNCSKIGHIAPACRLSRSTKGSAKPAKEKAKSSQRVHQVEDDHDLEFEMLFNVGTPSDRNIIWVNPIVEGKSIKMELDTGSGVSVISKRDCEKWWPKCKLKKTKLILKTYSGEHLIPVGVLNCQVRINNQSENLKLYVIENENRPLFGREWLQALKLNWSEIKLLNVGNIPHKLDELKMKYKSVFEKELGHVKGVKAHLTLKEGAQPKFIKARSVPFAMKPKIEKELNKLVNEGVLEPVKHSQWATPIVAVPKSNGDLRLCGDFKVTVNPALEVEQYPLPRIEEIFMSLGKGQKFSKLDLKQAYLQIPVDEESKELLTISTHKGLFRYNRLLYGIASAPAIFQRLIESVIDIPNVKVILDDMIVTGATDDEHLDTLEKVLQRLDEYGFHLNVDKCAFMQEKVEFCGHEIDREGLHKTDEKISAIVNAPEITSLKELRSFLGLVQYYAKFLPNLSTILHPLHVLLHKNAKWIWTNECQEAVNKVKKMIASDMVLINYDPDLPLILACDASSYGLGAVLSHKLQDGSERPIAFASRSLNKAEKNYSQIDKEALSLIWGIRKFHTYVYGRHFTLLTDHKPLTSIFNPTKSVSVTTAARLQRYSVFLSGYTYTIQYKSTKLHGNCDSLSRLPLETVHVNELDEVELLYNNVFELLPVTSDQVAMATKRDRILSQIYEYVSKGWEISSDKSSFEFEPYINKQNDLSIHQGCLLWGLRVIIPESLRVSILNELHSGHVGIVKMKSLARSYVWYPGIDHDLESVAKACKGCMENKLNPPQAEIHPWEYPTKPWYRLHIDFAGPFMDYMYLVVVDAYSKWPIVKMMKKTTTTNTIELLREIFSDYGVCEEIVSDNGPQFVSEQFEEFLKRNGVRHIKSAPYHPRTNGLAERFVQTFKQAMKSAKHDSGSIHTKLCKFLLQYRNSEHSVTKESPAKLLFNRSLSTRLDKLKPDLRDRVQNAQAKMIRSNYNPQFDIGDSVTTRDYRERHEKWIPGIVKQRTGPVSYRVEIAPGVCWKRHSDQLRSSDLYPIKEPIVNDNFGYTPPPQVITTSDTVPKEPVKIPCVPELKETPKSKVEPKIPERRYPVRERKKVEKLNL